MKRLVKLLILGCILLLIGCGGGGGSTGKNEETSSSHITTTNTDNSLTRKIILNLDESIDNGIADIYTKNGTIVASNTPVENNEITIGVSPVQLSDEFLIIKIYNNQTTKGTDNQYEEFLVTKSAIEKLQKIYINHLHQKLAEIVEKYKEKSEKELEDKIANFLLNLGISSKTTDKTQVIDNTYRLETNVALSHTSINSASVNNESDEESSSSITDPITNYEQEMKYLRSDLPISVTTRNGNLIFSIHESSKRNETITQEENNTFFIKALIFLKSTRKDTSKVIEKISHSSTLSIPKEDLEGAKYIIYTLCEKTESSKVCYPARLIKCDGEFCVPINYFTSSVEESLYILNEVNLLDQEKKEKLAELISEISNSNISTKEICQKLEDLGLRCSLWLKYLNSNTLHITPIPSL
jgi:hypothetical protein